MLRRALLCSSLLLAAATAGAQARAAKEEPSLAQLAHRTWTSRDGVPNSVWQIAQTRDGFLWLAGATGLARFDGVRFERYEPPPGQALPATSVNVLLAAPDGALWVGYSFGGVSTITANGLVSYGLRDGLPEGTVTSLAYDSAGTMWAATARGLARLTGARWHVVGPEIGYPGGFTNELTVDRHGALWVAGSAGVHVLPRGGRRFAWRAPSLAVGPYEVGTGSVRAAPDGSVWALGKSQGIMRLSDSAGRPLPPSVYYDRDLGRRRGWAGMFIDRHSRAWGATADRLVRVALGGREGVPPGAAVWDTLPLPPLDGRSGAMTGNQAHTVFEDREGTIWVATETGLEQFRVPKVTPVKWPVPDAPAIAAADGGALWAADDEGTLRLVGARDDAPAVPATLPNAGTVAYRDLSGEVWMGGVFGLWHLREGRFTAVALPPEFREAPVVAIARDRDGVLWVGAQRRGVFRQRGGAWERYSAPGSTAYTIVADSAGRTWLAYRDGRLVREGPGAARTYGPADGLRVGSILTVVVRGSRVWVGGELGVAVADLGAPGGSEARPRFAALVSPDRPFRGVGGIVAADDAVWLHDADGLARIESAEVARALRDARYRVRAERFDHRDRVDEGADFTAVPSMVAGTDGRLWVTWLGGVGLIDPANLPRNRVPPPVHIRMLDAGGEQYAATSAVTLPERTRALRIAYTATSLAVPERVRFRYRLLGLDTTWQEAGARREAFYTNLGPGEYHFQVVAANDDGVWNTRGAALDVVIPPTFWQTNLFLALCVGAASGAVVLGAQWRQRRAADAIRARFAVTLAERTRVARELHDTLLSGVAGIAMRLDAVATRAGSPAGVDVAALDELREQARHTLVDARRAVVGMRAAGDAAVPVSAQLAEAARRVFAGTDVNARVGSTGTPCGYPAEVEEQAVRIATEAMTNARKHAGCRAVRVTCAYRPRELCVSVRDDGRGFDPARAGANGHFGLVGMRERAAAVGARLTVDSAPGRGTTVQFVAPRPASD